jgi:hypothetical protein
MYEKELLLSLKKFQEYIVRQVKPPARTLIPRNNASAIPALSGKNIICKMWIL